jgi:hypothetical protein
MAGSYSLAIFLGGGGTPGTIKWHYFLSSASAEKCVVYQNKVCNVDSAFRAVSSQPRAQ